MTRRRPRRKSLQPVSLATRQRNRFSQATNMFDCIGLTAPLEHVGETYWEFHNVGQGLPTCSSIQSNCNSCEAAGTTPPSRQAQVERVSAEAAAAATAACPRFEQLLSQLRQLAAETEAHALEGDGTSTQTLSAPCFDFVFQPQIPQQVDSYG